MKRIKLLFAAIAAMVGLGAYAQSWTGNAVAEGTFFLYNVGAGKFLNNGDPNADWGTNAYLQEGFGMDVVLASKDGGYTIDTNVSNGGDSHYFANSTWCDGGATTWTFKAVDGETNVYQIIYDGQYLMANVALNDVEMVGDPGSRVTSTYWKLVTEQDFKDAMVAKTYSATDPMDVSVFIKGRSFARNDGRNTSWVTTHNGGNWTWIGSSANKYYGNESWNNTFDVHQAITGLPEGTYEVRCSGFGTNGTTYIYGNSSSKAIQTDNTTSYGTNKEAKWKAIHEDNAFAGQSTGTFTVGDGNLTVGIKREKNNGGDWAIWDEFRLYYYGLDLSEFSTALANAVAAAEAVEGTVPTVAYDALAAVVTENNKTYTSASAYQAATNAIISATNTAKAFQASYARYTSVKTAILAINSGIDLSAADTQANEATTNEAIDAAVVTARTALGNYFAGATIEDQEIDLTAALIDNAAPGTAGNLNYWTNSGNPGLEYSLYEYYNVAGATSKQTIATQLPVGYYKMTVIGYTREGYDAFINAGENKQTLVGVASGTVNNRNQGNSWIAQGNGVNEMIFQLTDATTNLEIGITAGQTGDRWTVWRSFKLEYLGTAPLSLFQDRLAAAATAAENHATELSGTIPSAVSTAYTAAINTAKAANTTTTECLQSISDIEAATASADALVAPYAMYKSMAEAATTEGVDSDVISDQDAAVEEATTVAGIQACTGVLQRARVVLAIGESENVDLTSFVDNLDFEQGNLRSWTSANGGNVANNNNFGLKQGTWYAERWQNGVALGAGSLTHDDIYLPAGFYKITADAQNIEQYNSDAAGKGLFLCANADQTEIGAAANYEVYVKLNSDDVLSIKFLQDNCTGNWISYDNITLTYVAADFPAYALVEGKMNAAVATAQSTAKAAFDENATATNYFALTNAIAAAQASKDAYTAAATAIADAKALKDAHNFVTADAATTFAAAIAAIETPYNEGSLADADASAAGTTLGVSAVGWHAARAEADYTPAEIYMKSAGFNAEYNDWSVEGVTDGTNFLVPFFQNWTNDDQSLANTTITGTLTGLANGLYKVSAWVRVRAKNETAAADATGITMDVNGGGEGEYAAVDVTEGTQIGESQFRIGTYTAQGLVKDGTLTLNFNITDTNISWLSFKNVNYTKVRDLTPEEMAVAPTAIALYNGETEVTEPIALDKTNSTVTLNPVYTPAEASEGYINWTSSDESVATVSSLGEVTAVLPGTATITATSTLDNTVSATATINVSYPESSYETSTYVNEGATRKVLTLGENLIKNGSFEYPNAYYGWTYGTGSTTPITSEKFAIETEGAADGDQYLRAKTNEGGAAAGSLNTSWAIEPGKTYVFGYKIKSSAASTGNQYIGTSLNTTKGQENSSTKLANPAYGTDWTDVVYTFESGENTWLVFNARWLANNVSFDNFYLCEAEYTLEGNVDYATAAIPTANIGTGAFQYSQDAIDAANDLVQGTASVADVEAAYEALTTINEPADGQLFNVVLTYGGWTYDQKAMTYLAGDRSDMGGYNIKYQAAANENLAQAFTFTKVSGNNYKMSQIDADGNVRYICTVTGGGYGNNNTSGIRTTTDASKALVVTVIPTATDGVWNLRNTEANNYIGSQDAGVYTVNSHIDFNIVETHKPSISINTTAAGWGTVILPFVATLPDGVKAYSVETIGEEKADRLDLVEVNALEANKPYIIEGAWEETVTGDAQGINLTYTVGLLTGVYTQRAATAGTYVLQNNDNKVGFYRVESGEEPTVGANRAYLTVPAAAGDVKAFFFGDDTATAIQSVFSGVAAGEIYDLSGRKLNKLQKGVNIVNGKKVMVK